MERHIAIGDYCYDLPEERIAQFPLARRSDSKLLVWQGGEIGERRFVQIGADDRCAYGAYRVAQR